MMRLDRRRPKHGPYQSMVPIVYTYLLLCWFSTHRTFSVRRRHELPRNYHGRTEQGEQNSGPKLKAKRCSTMYQVEASMGAKQDT